MSIAPPPDVQRFLLLVVAVLAWLLSIPVFIICVLLFFAVPSATLGAVMMSWFAALIYGALLIYRAWREKAPTSQAISRLIGAVALNGAGCLIGFLLVWAVMSFAAASAGGSIA